LHNGERSGGAGSAIEGDGDRAGAGGRGGRDDSSQLVIGSVIVSKHADRGIDHGDVDLGDGYGDLYGGTGQSCLQGNIAGGELLGRSGGQALTSDNEHASLGDAVVRQAGEDVTGGVNDTVGPDGGRLGLRVQQTHARERDYSDGEKNSQIVAHKFSTVGL